MALGKIFEQIGEKIIPKEECLLMAPIKRVIEEYPKEYEKIIAYLHYMKSMRPDDNPYADVPVERRSDIILFNLKLSIDPEDEAIKDALACVEEIYYTTFYGIYKGFKTYLDKLGAQLQVENVNFAKDGNATVIKGYLKDYESMRKSFKVAFKDFEEEQGVDRVRGGAELAEDEQEDYD